MGWMESEVLLVYKYPFYVSVQGRRDQIYHSHSIDKENLSFTRKSHTDKEKAMDIESIQGSNTLPEIALFDFMSNFDSQIRKCAVFRVQCEKTSHFSTLF